MVASTLVVKRSLPAFGTKKFRTITGDDDDYETWCEYPEHRIHCRLPSQQPHFITKTGRIKTPKHVQFIVGSEPVPRQNENFCDLLAIPTEINSTFNDLGYTVEVSPVSCRNDLMIALRNPARLRVVLVHGDEHYGLECPDGDVAWDDLSMLIGPTGLLMLLSCFSHDVEVVDPDDVDGEECPLPDVLFPLVPGYVRRVNALITATQRSHHFRWRFNDNTHFEIQRIATLLELCDLYGFEQAVGIWVDEIKQNLHPVVVESILGHECIRGNSGKICGTMT